MEKRLCIEVIKEIFYNEYFKRRKFKPWLWRQGYFQNVSFRLLKGEHIGLIGANGEGKSTFMNIITGKSQPDEGKVEWAKRVRIGYLDQHTVLEKGMTIRDVLKSAFAFLFELEEQMNAICDHLGMHRRMR